MPKKPQSIKRSQTIGLIWRWVLAVVLITFSIFPVLWIVSASINPVNDLANQKLIPDNWSFVNFRQLVTNPIFPFFTWLKNSLIISTVSTLLTLSLTTLAAFAFSAGVSGAAPSFGSTVIEKPSSLQCGEVLVITRTPSYTRRVSTADLIPLPRALLCSWCRTNWYGSIVK